MLRDERPHAGTSAESPAGSASRRFVAGDPLRAVAAGGVVLFHLSWPLLALGVPAGRSALDTVAQLAEIGRLGLYVFFVLSGYLLGRPFLRAFVERRPPPDVWSYLRNRALRIAPAFWVAVTLTVVAFGTAWVSWRQIVALYLFAQDVEPSRLSVHLLQGWTIGLELCFYVALPVVALLLGVVARPLARRGRTVVVWTLLPAAFVGSLPFPATTNGSVSATGWPRSLPAVLFAFVPGLVLAAAEPGVRAWLGAGRRRGRRLSRALLAAALVAAAVHVDVILTSPRWFVSASAAGVAGALVAAALVLQWSGGGAWRALDNPPMGWLGERSYGIYLFHVLAMGVVFDRVKHLPTAAAATALVVGTIALTVMLAALSYRFVERPFLRLRHGWRRGGAAAATAPIPSAPAPLAAGGPSLGAPGARGSTASPAATTLHSPR